MTKFSQVSMGALIGAPFLFLTACGPADEPPAPSPEPSAEAEASQDEADEDTGAEDDADGEDDQPDGWAEDEGEISEEEAVETGGMPEGDLIDALSEYCGQAFEGEITRSEAEEADADAGFEGERLVMHVRECEDDAAYVPFHVGENRSRTWIITRLDDGALRLKHDHRNEDGSEDELTQYGGETEGAPAGWRAEFPADQESRDLFEAQDIEVSMDNVWIMQVDPDAETFVYALTRPNRYFEVTFDLTEPVEAPEAPWGYED